LVHRRAPTIETLSITISAVPSFEAVGRLLEATNPFLFWSRVLTEGARAVEAAWAPWLGAASYRRLKDR
jgi:hypothetical protein